MKYTDLTPEVGEVYRPTSALVFYEDSNRYNPQSYVEYLHLDSNGNPTSAQPLTLDQAQALAKTLTCQKEQAQAFLVPKGIIPRRVLHLSHKGEGQAVWYSKAQKSSCFCLLPRYRKQRSKSTSSVVESYPQEPLDICLSQKPKATP